MMSTKQARSQKMNKKGFTLTEVLIVVIIAAALAALIVPRGLKAIAQANFLADQSNMDTIQEAVFLCYSEQRDWDVCDSEAELVPEYIEAFPVHPCDAGTYTIEDTTDGTAGKEVVNSSPCPDPTA